MTPPALPKPDKALNKQIGSRIRLKRESLGMNQSEVGRIIGAGRAKIGQIESGDADISVSELFRLSIALEEPFRAFLADLEAVRESEQSPISAETISLATTLNRDAIELLTGFAKINDPAVRRSLIAVVHSYAEAAGNVVR